MKKIYNYLRSYLKDNFQLGLFLSIAAFLAFAIWFNYFNFTAEVNGEMRFVRFESYVLRSARGGGIYFLLNFIYYLVPYLVGALAIGVFGYGFAFLKKPGFWIVLGIFCAVQAGDATWKWYDLADWLGYEGQKRLQLRSYLFKMTAKVVRASFYFIPITIYYLIRRKKMTSFHGLTLKGFDMKPYLVMMLIMTPMLVWASFDADFLRTYPTYTPGRAAAFWDIPIWSTFGAYELLYGLTFVGLELLFRGYLIFEMEKYLGEKVVIPMVCVYCTLHFGKPVMECVSSIFGGFILGVIALKSRSVFGGIWVHVFIALGMDILAFLQEEIWDFIPK